MCYNGSGVAHTRQVKSLELRLAQLREQDVVGLANTLRVCAVQLLNTGIQHLAISYHYAYKLRVERSQTTGLAVQT